VVTDAGGRHVVKIGPLGFAAQWRSAHRALDLAPSVGVPVAPLVGSTAHADRLVRAFAWIEGQVPDPGTLADDAVRRLFTDLGVALRALQGFELDAFGSRLDGSAPSFTRRPDHLEYRLAAITARCRATGALGGDELKRVCGAVDRLAAGDGDHPRPTLRRRDPCADNLLVDPDGRLVAVPGFDTAEAWDRAGEFDRLDRLLLAAFPGARRWFDAACRGRGPTTPVGSGRSGAKGPFTPRPGGLVSVTLPA
jgi:aminoglycoside phosphotransferase (APT) family kinase protein